MFEIHVKRHRWNVTEGEATIEIAVVVGKVIAANREARLFEIELEKKAGPPAALFALAYPEMNAATVFAHIAAPCLRQFRLNEMALSWSRNAVALHQARVPLRRLRSLFSICRSLFGDSRFDRMRANCGGSPRTSATPETSTS